MRSMRRKWRRDDTFRGRANMGRLLNACEVCDVLVNTVDESEGHTDCIANEVGRAALMSLCHEIATTDLLMPPKEVQVPNDWMGIIVPVSRRVLVPELAKRCHRRRKRHVHTFGLLSRSCTTDTDLEERKRILVTRDPTLTTISKRRRCRTDFTRPWGTCYGKASLKRGGGLIPLPAAMKPHIS